MSFSRPDPSSPAQVADANFSTQRRGFDQSEVRDFLRMVSAELARLHERERFLERELSTAQSNPDLESAQFDDETLTRMLGEETARVLNAARASSREIREKAEQSAARMLTEASNDSTRLREEAEIEASRRRADAANDAEAELAMAKQQGREMVDEARAYRERVLGELSRRRELAREQIEQLIHGRDRLTQAFERARLVAVDVVAEMQPLGEPDEYVNLQPSTGPVPVMVARDDMRSERAPLPVEGPAQSDSADDVELGSHTGDLRIVLESGDVEAGDVESGEFEAGDVESGEFEAGSVETPAAVDGRDLQIIEPTDEVEAVEVVAHDVEDDDAPSDIAVPVSHDDDPHVSAEAEADAESEVHGEAEPEPDGDTEHADGGAEQEAEAEDEDEAEAELESDPDDDDVVVDLFARLRADSVDASPSAGGESAEAADPEDVTDPDVVPAETLTPFEQRDDDLAPLVAASARKLKRALADEQNDVLDALRRIDQVRTLDALLPWASEHAERYTSTLLDELLVAAHAGASSVAPGRKPLLRPAAGRDAVEHATTALTGSLVDPLRDRLSRCIDEGDGDNQVITKKVRSVYREWKTQRIDEVLDDVFRTSHARGLLAAVDPDGPVEWVADPAETTCSECHDNQLAGAVASGQEFPTGHVCTPAHPGCRCVLVPAVR